MEDPSSECFSSDIHICGMCKKQFSSIEHFIEHKSKKCNVDNEINDELPQGLDLSAEFAMEQQQTSTLRARLLGLAEAAQAELLESSVHTSLTREDFSRNDEEDAADVLVNQLAGIGQHHFYEISVNAEGTPTETQELSQETEEVIDSIKQDQNTKKLIKKSPGKKKNKKDKHVVVHKAAVFKCNEVGCSFEGKYYKDLIRHTRIHTGEKPFECHICSRSFSRGDKLKQHLRIHSGEKPFQCNLCSYACVDGSSLRKHQRTHTDERPCKCQLCPYSARDTSQLIVHLRTHTGDVPFVCLAPGCKSAFKTSSDLKRHTRLHTDEKPFSCDTCNYRTRMKGNLLAHMRRAHLGGKKKYPCNVCNAFVAATHSALQEHKKTHASMLLRCNVGNCEYVGMNVAAIRCHLRSKHPEECPLLSCKHCSFACPTAGEMRSHMKEFHPTILEKKYKKSNATKTSNIKQDLLNVNNKQTPYFNKTFKCPICSVSYVREDSLRAHIRVHQRACNGQKGVVVVDTSVVQDEDPDEPSEIISTQEKQVEIPSVPESFAVLNPDMGQHSSQQVVFYVPNVVNTETNDHLLLTPNSGNSILEQLHLQQGVQYILVPSSATEGFEPQVATTFQH